jgi:hypothetical protein
MLAGGGFDVRIKSWLAIYRQGFAQCKDRHG